MERVCERFYRCVRVGVYIVGFELLSIAYTEFDGQIVKLCADKTLSVKQRRDKINQFIKVVTLKLCPISASVLTTELAYASLRKRRRSMSWRRAS